MKIRQGDEPSPGANVAGWLSCGRAVSAPMQKSRSEPSPNGKAGSLVSVVGGTENRNSKIMVCDLANREPCSSAHLHRD